MVNRPIMLRAQTLIGIRAGRRTHLTMAATFVPGRRTPVGEGSRLAASRTGGMVMPTPWAGLKPGDRLWVQEEVVILHDQHISEASQSFYKTELPTGQPPIPGRGTKGSRYRTETIDAIRMPREHSRYTLALVDVRHFRAAEITWDEIKAEGDFDPHQTKGAWWQYRYGIAMPWAENPEAVGLTFEFVDGNIDTGERWVPDAPPGNPNSTDTKAVMDAMFGTWPVND